MLIRVAKPEDCERIGELWHELVMFHVKLDKDMPVEAPQGAKRYAQRIENYLDDPYMYTLVAEIDGQMVGYVNGLIVDMMPDVFVEEKSGMIGDIFVLEAYRQQGVGKALVQGISDWFKLRGLK
jgi:GNAT superfamily N-acetyltransferase